MKFQRYTDAFLAKTLLPLIPRSVTPNMVSWVRVAALPFIFLLLEHENYAVGFAIFTIAALTDALDGAMARTRDQITEVGKVLDAVADRGLIALVAIIFIPKFYGWGLVIVLALLELGNGLAAYISRRRIGFNPGANWAGKLKMFVQCIAFGMFFIGMFEGKEAWLAAAFQLLIVSCVLAGVQLVSYPSTREEAENA